MTLLKAQMAGAKLSHVYTIGQILMEVALTSERAAELIEQDLAVKICNTIYMVYISQKRTVTPFLSLSIGVAPALCADRSLLCRTTAG